LKEDKIATENWFDLITVKKKKANVQVLHVEINNFILFMWNEGELTALLNCTFTELCFMVHIREQDQQDAHAFS